VRDAAIQSTRFCLFFLFPLGACAQSGQPSAQAEQSSTVLKANTRLVIVDVVVTDGKGAPVSGLESADFTVLDNGRPQQISNFSFQHPGALAGAQSPLPPNVFTNIPKTRSSSLNVILVDALNGEYGGRAYALDQLAKYLGIDPPSSPQRFLFWSRS
jgi:VWFA-related protein